jgi:hypothetical protein
VHSLSLANCLKNLKKKAILISWYKANAKPESGLKTVFGKFILYRYLPSHNYSKNIKDFGFGKSSPQNLNRRYRYRYHTQLANGSGCKSGSIHQSEPAHRYGTEYQFGSEHQIDFTYRYGSGPGDGSVPRHKATFKKIGFLKGGKNSEKKHNIAFMHRMGDEYDSLLRSLGMDDTMASNDADATANSAGDESLLDVDDEDEVRVLDPPLLPTPATDPVVNCQTEPEKVNAEVYEFMNIESDSKDLSSQNTQSTIFTVYSKFGIREGYNYSNVEHDPESDRSPMSSLYHQCKTARVATMTQMCTSVEIRKEIGTEKQIGFNPIGSFNCIGDTEILRTFRGSRLTSNNTDVNQNISLSFDPATLVCVACEKPHPILQTGEGGAPPIIVITDQNFMPTLSGGG